MGDTSTPQPDGAPAVTADMGAVVSDSRKLSDTGAVAFPQDPPADVLQQQLADALEAAYHASGEWLDFADALLHELTADALAVVHADVPHGSRAEQVGFLNARGVDVFRWVAPSVDGDER